ncbi:MAG: molybdopterin molybdotransferase MoeA [Deltaproteobacteria bacterium]|nr:molybdopterin molybdotransferase MoeA [Deltaproteobacteria bacterium]
MLSFSEALQIVLGAARPLDAEKVALRECLGRVLAEDVVSDIDMPPFDKSAMDGYACRRADIRNPLESVEVIPAGIKPQRTLGKNQCAKIMTGAPVPEGADCVLMVEQTRLDPGGRVLFLGKEADHHIFFKGGDVRAGEVVLRRFGKIGPQHVAILATVGKVQPLVSRRPKVGVIATGDELVEPSQFPPPFSIRNSNSYQLCAQVRAADSIPTYYGIAKDRDEEIDTRLKQALKENDVVLLSGGVSMGDFDLTPEIMKRNGIDIRFDSIAIKPGKPTHFGVAEGACCFGLPGNPVSAFLQFEILVKPFLYKLMGHDLRILHTTAVLEQDVSVRPSDRESWIPVSLVSGNRAMPLTYHGSAHINAMAEADGFIVIPVGSTGLSRGTTVRVRHL